MKYSLYCFLFGHNWKSYEGIKNGYKVWRAIDNCSRCGLSKEEAGITSNQK